MWVSHTPKNKEIKVNLNKIITYNMNAAFEDEKQKKHIGHKLQTTDTV